MAQLPQTKMMRALSMNAENNVPDLLNALSDEVNRLYGYVTIPGDNFGEPAINSGPCGAFAHAFLKLWNQKFSEKAHIVFIMVKNADECWHVLVRLPNRLLYDGGHGLHSEDKYSGKFDIVDMVEYDIGLLEKYSYGLDREYPRYCPNFSINTMEGIIGKYLNLIQKNITFKPINQEHPLLASVISASIGFPTTEKIAQVLQSYKQPNKFLVGAFTSENLIAVIGFECKGTKAIIKHISVSDFFKKQGIGNCLIKRIIKDHTLSSLILETDDESVGFYKKLGFKCESFDGEYGNRYCCHLALLSPDVAAIKYKLLAAVKKFLSHFPDMHGELAISIGDDIIYHENFTYTDAPWTVNKNSQYLIASITKQFTAAAILKTLYDRQVSLGIGKDPETFKQLIQDDLHKPVSFFLPPEHSAWNNNMPSWANTVTVHHLLTHTSGIKKINETTFDETLEYVPGQQFLYSNPNYVLIGTIISELTKTTLDVYFKRVLFEPAEMQNTHFPMTGTPKELQQQDDFKNLALGFEYNLLPSEVTFNAAGEKISFDELDVAGGIISTVKDCVKWNNALYHGKIIPSYLVDLMFLQHIPAIPFPTYYGLDSVWYGYGIEVYYEGQKICYQHAGGCPGYQGRLIYLPVSNITIVHLSNSQKDNVSLNNAKKMLSDEHQCDLAAIESIFDEKFPHYKSRLQNRINIFDFANELRGLFL